MCAIIKKLKVSFENYTITQKSDLMRIHSWDTETIDFDVKEESPVGHGKIISAQLFCGPEVEFENGPMVFVDNFGDAKDTINHFKDYFENEEMKKVWFNYGFDRHLFFNHGINVKGFAGDVMHMARLLDSSREPKDYSLGRISIFYKENINEFKSSLLKNLKKTQKLSEKQQENLDLYTDNFQTMEKTSMSNLFARKKRLANGQEGKTYEVELIGRCQTYWKYTHPRNW